MKKAEFIGRRFGKLLVTDVRSKQYHGTKWVCLCDCGEERILITRSLTKGANCCVKCKGKELHGESNTRLYFVWIGLRNRCNRKEDKNYISYGGRGIKVHPSWQNSYLTFKADMGCTYKEGLTLDRIDVNGDYSPANCRWATITEQNRNKRCTKLIDTPWGKITTGEASEKSGIAIHVLKLRQYYKFSNDRMFEPVREHKDIILETPWGKMTVKEASEKSGICIATLDGRYRRWGNIPELLFKPL